MVRTLKGSENGWHLYHKNAPLMERLKRDRDPMQENGTSNTTSVVSFMHVPALLSDNE